MATRWAGVWLAALMAIAVGGPAAAACKMQVLMDLPVAVVRQKAVVPAKLDGQDVTLVVDTGAFMNGMTLESANRFGLPLRPTPSSFRVGGGDGSGFQLTSVPDLVLGHTALKNVDFLVGGRIVEVGAAGRIGMSMFTETDLELDLGHGALRVLKAQDCAGPQAAYWAQGTHVSSVTLDPGTPLFEQPRGVIQVNGQPVHVMFDTGAQRSHVNRPAAQKAGLDLAAAVKTGAIRRAIDGVDVPTLDAKAKTLAIGDEQATEVTLQVADIRAPGYDGLVGMDFFMAHRVLFDREHSRLYFTSNAGRLFEPADQPPAGPNAATEAPPLPAAGSFKPPH